MVRCRRGELVRGDVEVKNACFGDLATGVSNTTFCFNNLKVKYKLLLLLLLLLLSVTTDLLTQFVVLLFCIFPL